MSFQLAKFSLTLHPASIQFMRDVTPPELMILQQLHFKESSGSPIGADLQLQSNTAVTVDVDEKPFEPEYFHSGTGKIVPAKPAIPAVTHTRTGNRQAEQKIQMPCSAQSWKQKCVYRTFRFVTGG